MPITDIHRENTLGCPHQLMLWMFVPLEPCSTRKLARPEDHGRGTWLRRNRVVTGRRHHLAA